MRGIDLLFPTQKDAIAKFFWNLAIAELPCDTSREKIIDRAIRIGKSVNLIASDFEGIEENG